MEKIKFALLVFTLLLAFPVITILELNRNRQSIPLNESTAIETGKLEKSFSVSLINTNVVFKRNINQHDTVNNPGNKKGHNKYAL